MTKIMALPESSVRTLLDEFTAVGPSGVTSVLPESGEGLVEAEWPGPDGKPFTFHVCGDAVRGCQNE